MTNVRKSVYRYDYRRSGDQDAGAIVRRPVVVVGAGPVGLATAIELALRDVPVVLVDDADRIGEGSRGICWSKRTLEILDRLGAAERLVARGVTWKLGKVFCGDELLFSFDLLPEEGHKMPALINLQQFYLEKVLVDRALEKAGEGGSKRNFAARAETGRHPHEVLLGNKTLRETIREFFVKLFRKG